MDYDVYVVFATKFQLSFGLACENYFHTKSDAEFWIQYHSEPGFTYVITRLAKLGY